MNKIIMSLCFLTYFLINPQILFAQWTKYTQNPIISASSSGCDKYNPTAPSVIYDNNMFKMWYQASNGINWVICYATSSDGITWTKNTSSIFTPTNYNSQNVLEVTEPMVLKNDTYHMWFKEGVSTTAGVKFRLRHATSTDGNTWNMNQLPVLEGNEIGWDKIGPSNPYVLYENNIYHLWYLSRNDTMSWRIGYATSTDGDSWIKYSNNPINIPIVDFAGGMSVLKINNEYHMWYHIGSGSDNVSIYHVISQSLQNQNWICESNCEILSRTQNTFDSNGITTPDVINYNNQLLMWYGGWDNNYNIKIGLAYIGTYPQVIPTNTPTPTPTATPTPTIAPTLTPIPTSTPIPTPTVIENQKIPVVIIPGLFGSWNNDAIIHNKPTTQKDWYLTPFINDYNALITSLKNIGYVLNKNYFIFSYDWRKNISETSNKLDLYLNNNIFNITPNSKIQIIGHSLGGLVGKFWFENNLNKVDKLVTVGTPYLGTAQVYKPVEAGEIDRFDNIIWLAEKSILMLNKNSIETDRVTLNRYIPVLQNLFPKYPFLKQSGVFLAIDDMKIKNNSGLSNNYFNNEFTINGSKGNTLFGYNVTSTTKLEKLLNNYVDGKPLNELKEIGDYVIVSKSSSIGNNLITLSYDHGELIYKKESIKEILNTLKISYDNNQIIEGKGTQISPSLIFMIKSSATMEVQLGNNIYKETDGILFIENAQSGNYSLKITGKEKGDYTILIGQIGTQSDEWSEIHGTITKNPPSSQIDSYVIKFDDKNPKKEQMDFTIGFEGTSSTISTTTSNPSNVCNDTKPGNVPVLQSVLAGVNSVTLNWSEANDPVSYYLVAYGVSPNNNTYGNPNVGGRGTTSYTVNYLSGGSTYCFIVRAGNGCKPGDFSNEICTTTEGGFVTEPAEGFNPGVLGVATEEAKITTPEGKLNETKGAKTVNICLKCIWWQILLGEIIALFVYFKIIHSKIKERKYTIFTVTIPLLTYVIYFILNKSCFSNFFTSNSNIFFCKYFMLIDTIIITTFVLIKKRSH
ncbi:MAG: fibronectin type III domain-containing protein [bacterium]|nr:fibronectin type III domain-containing protein [bacterium]